MSAIIGRIAPADLDLGTAAVLAAIDNAALDGVPLRHHTAETFLLDCHDPVGEGPHDGLWLAHLDGVLVGWAGLNLNRHENLDSAKILGAVHPDHRRRGVGRALMAAAEAGTDRPRLRAPAWAGTAGERAVPALGYARTASHEVRRLDLRDEQPADLVSQAEEAGRDYDLERFSGACPDDVLDDLRVLREAINDAPRSGEFEHYSTERLRAEEASLARRRRTTYTVLARHRATGKPAGISFLAVHDLRPAIAEQEDTSVLPDHRGRRLGLRMKLAMLDWLRSERPDVESVDTWNAPDNAPIIAINEALGCRKVAETIRYVKER